jgi:hypothetical protein
VRGGRAGLLGVQRLNASCTGRAAFGGMAQASASPINTLQRRLMSTRPSSRRRENDHARGPSSRHGGSDQPAAPSGLERCARDSRLMAALQSARSCQAPWTNSFLRLRCKWPSVPWCCGGARKGQLVPHGDSMAVDSELDVAGSCRPTCRQNFAGWCLTVLSIKSIANIFGRS